MKNYTVEQMLEAIEGSNGIVSRVADKLKCDWVTANTYIKKFPQSSAAFDAELEKVLDMAEAKIFRSIAADDTDNAKWLLSKKGKHRGYGDQKEITLNGNMSFSASDIELAADKIKQIINEVGE